MANMLMASSTKSLMSATPTTPKPKSPLLPKFPILSIPSSPQALKRLILSPPPSLKQLASAVATSMSLSYLLPLPSLAAEIEKAALFDFNLTLPIIMVEFLLLMFALDKIYYTPLGNFMDERDAAIKEKLGSVKDTSEEVKQLEEQAAAVMRAARAEISAALNKMKKETALEVEAKLAEGRKKVEAELQEALAGLEKQRDETVKALDSQISALSEEIVKKATGAGTMAHAWTLACSTSVGSQASEF
ncbi:ATP synthase subunit b 2, variant 2 [Ancistrocladus abbreviatus]